MRAMPVRIMGSVARRLSARWCSSAASSRRLPIAHWSGFFACSSTRHSVSCSSACLRQIATSARTPCSIMAVRCFMKPIERRSRPSRCARRRFLLPMPFFWMRSRVACSNLRSSSWNSGSCFQEVMVLLQTPILAASSVRLRRPWATNLAASICGSVIQRLREFGPCTSRSPSRSKAFRPDTADQSSRDRHC